jgi:hypothetical protein
MQGNVAQVHGRSAAVGHRSPGHSHVDGRTMAARRVKALVSHFVAELDGPDAVSAVQMLRVRRAAELITTSEQMRAAALRGEDVDHLALVRIENLAARAIAVLHLDRNREPGMRLRPIEHGEVP